MYCIVGVILTFCACGGQVRKDDSGSGRISSSPANAKHAAGNISTSNIKGTVAPDQIGLIVVLLVSIRFEGGKKIYQCCLHFYI
jgi:hypothetical protein